MIRPVYETAADRQAEEEVAKVASSYFRCETKRMKEFSKWDYQMFRDGRLIAVAEIKCRPTYSWAHLKRLGGYMISKKKFDAISKASKAAGVMAAIIVRDKNHDIRACVWRGDDPPLKIEQRRGGRRDRGDKQDVEICCYIPTQQFFWQIKENRSD